MDRFPARLLPSGYRALLWLAFVVVSGFCVSDPGRAQDNKKTASAYAGSDTCGQCHEDQVKWMAGSVHSPAMTAEKKKPGSGGGCEACHGPGDAHANDPQKSNILTFKTESTLRRSNACLSCHAKKAGLMDFQRTSHRKQRIACDQCHTSGDSKLFHSMRTGSELRRGSETGLCLGCHGEKKAAFSMPFRHRVNEGEVFCSDCHREHTGFRTGRRRAALEDETCVRCHTEKSGPFVFEHLPIRAGGCQACHTPHGATNSRLLTRNDVRTLCLECHANTPAGHNLSQPRYQNCTICHKAIHGSNSHKLFFE